MGEDKTYTGPMWLEGAFEGFLVVVMLVGLRNRLYPRRVIDQEVVFSEDCLVELYPPLWIVCQTSRFDALLDILDSGSRCFRDELLLLQDHGRNTLATDMTSDLMSISQVVCEVVVMVWSSES